jgi:CDP-L-myo-inositol myo-inositolphosphotransferase
MTFEKPGSAALSVRLAFGNAGEAEAPVAGIASVAHAAHLAGRRGAREIWIDLRDGARLSEAALDDVRRACPGILIRAGASERGGGLPSATVHHPFPLAGRGEAIRWLLRSTGKEGDGYISRRLNRPVSRAISAFLLTRFPAIRPNHATAGTAAVALLMFASLLFGGWPGLIAGGLLFHLASVLDGVDGEIARATYRSSPAGAVLDSAVDMATNLLFYVGITASLFRVYGRIQLEVGGWAVMAGLSGLVLLSWLVRQIGEPGNYDIIKRFYRARCAAGFPRFVVEMFVMITSRDFFAFGSMLLILAGQPRMVTLGLALFATLWLSLILLALPSLLRNGSAAAPAPLALDAGPSLP